MGWLVVGIGLLCTLAPEIPSWLLAFYPGFSPLIRTTAVTEPPFWLLQGLTPFMAEDLASE